MVYPQRSSIFARASPPLPHQRHYRAIDERNVVLVWGSSIIALEGRKHGGRGVPLTHQEADEDHLLQEMAS
ncbi:hypothetical protein E2C01_030456 [Portunus trituberculatus]|uniref:Uncharacterized protein n=1 Tax=Portunus trituberculatus TaxID=210409 RepID=A0A5B7EVS3_PORTR|nr:hypothetical protein [Portunus trituberculatus]